jgi:alanine-glyoxylate transaminase / serine-glyoxylate transaminase / serine-pyruvate transaminase
MSYRAGRHFLQIPGPSPVPDRISRAIDAAVIDHRGPDFAELGHAVLDGMKRIFKTKSSVVIYPSSGTGAWEAALSNVVKAGDHVIFYETGQFATLWKQMADRLGIVNEFISGDWRSGVDPNRIEDVLRADTEQKIRAVCCVHHETSCGITSNIAAVRAAIDAVGHPALLMADTISGLASVDFRHDEWGIDISVSGSQKGLMMPPGLGFNALSDRAIDAAKHGGAPRSYWDWAEMLQSNATGYFPYTPATTLLYGLREAISMLEEEGLENVFQRHQRLADACRAAVAAWGLETVCQNPAEHSNVLTGIMMPEGVDADAVRSVILKQFDMSLGTGLGKLKGKAFRVGHLGDFNELTLMGTLSGVEMGLGLAGVPHQAGGVEAAMRVLKQTAH